MARSRADEILEGWKMIAHTALRPADAPRPRVLRTALPGLAATAAGVMVLVVSLALRGGTPGPIIPGPGGTGSPAAPSTGTSPSVSPATMASPSPMAAASASPAAVTTARDAVDAYTADLVAGRYAAAWAMLGPEAQSAIGSLASFTAERSAFFRSVGGRYTVTAEPKDVGPISDWVAGTNQAQIEIARAVLVEVTYPALAGNNAGWDLYIVDLGKTPLRIYEVR